jgi:hypothetical protein
LDYALATAKPLMHMMAEWVLHEVSLEAADGPWLDVMLKP